MRKELMLIILAGLSAFGCAGAQAKQPFVFTVSLNRTEYQIGEPMVVTATLENTARQRLDVPRFDPDAIKFITDLKGSNLPVHREPVTSSELAPEPQQIKPGESITRPFLFTRTTEKPGEYSFVASFKGAVAAKKLFDEAVFAKPVTFRVADEVALKRDPTNGMILKEQALEIARKSADGEVKEAKAVLVPLGKSGLFTWVVMLTVETAEKKEKKYAVQVDPYVGKLRPLEAQRAASGADEVEAAEGK